MFEKELILFLEKFNCKTKLLHHIINSLKKIKNKSNIVPPLIETSYKVYNNGEKKDKRYIICLQITDFRLFEENDKTIMFELIGLQYIKFKDIINNFPKLQKIYFGHDDEKGKLYLSTFDSGLCYEATGKIKFYTFNKSNSNIMYLFSTETNSLDAIYLRLKNTNETFWCSFSKKFITYYYRPLISTLTNEEYDKLSVDDKVEYNLLKRWNYQVGFDNILIKLEDHQFNKNTNFQQESIEEYHKHIINQIDNFKDDIFYYVGKDMKQILNEIN